MQEEQKKLNDSQVNEKLVAIRSKDEEERFKSFVELYKEYVWSEDMDESERLRRINVIRCGGWQ